jgi:hypothetical protein
MPGLQALALLLPALEAQRQSWLLFRQPCRLACRPGPPRSSLPELCSTGGLLLQLLLRLLQAQMQVQVQVQAQGLGLALAQAAALAAGLSELLPVLQRQRQRVGGKLQPLWAQALQQAC